ncbi:uncharacterized protein IUM83_16742 [Phytophthora cinnamomi]|uniref:uncharacterized protein n=1 Tax=Phytophthora cinnamomi TaxID=4785 RepID=UPI003559BC30|nr:hypothetical protein IUM83_16742 [Phytophthora cinnamomi]
MFSPLLCVELVLLNRPDASALQDVAPTIADFLGPDRNLSLHEACNTGSLKLLDWIWRVSCDRSNDRAASWSLASYLQSDAHYYQWQFSESLEVAAGLGDIDVVQWLFQHFRGCQVAVEVVEAAAKNGHLGVLQFLLAHDAENRGRSELRGAGHAVHWGGHSLVDAVENGHSEVVQYLYRCASHRYDEAEVTRAIKTALRVGEMKLAEFLLPRGRCILDYAEFCSHPDVIEWKLDCGYYRRDPFSAGAAIKYLVRSGRLDLMQRIAEQHYPPPENADWSADWRSAMVHACVNGGKEILQWLMEHPAGRWTCRGDDRLFSELVFSAAYKGNIQVMQYLFEQGAVDKVRDALLHAIREGHFHMVKWLIEHFPESESIPNYCVLDEAARYGRLEMLEYFQGLDASVICGYVPSRRTARNSVGGDMVQMFIHASDGYLKVHSTLCRYRSTWNPTDAMDDAAANGQLDVVKWLHTHRSEGCTIAAMDCAAANGHLDVVQWLHEHRSEGCTTKAMDGAAENGHLAVVKWLYTNGVEGCTLKAVEGALRNGHLRVAVWLHKHHPALNPASVELWRRPPDLFELLLFQCAHLGGSFSPGLVEHAREMLLGGSSKSNHRHIIAWLQEKFPAAPGAREEQRQEEEEQWWGGM